DRFTLADGHSAGGLVVVPGGDHALGIGNDRAVVQKNIDVVLRRQKRADVALQHEIRTVRALDRFDNVFVGGVDQLADFATNRLLPIGQRIDVCVNTRIGRVGNF